ncbi:uncharacterized protein LOC117578507 [Drosophila guanche]|uniref:Mab-21-like nucleotidyltransferase domain-containing protein n=2 Tax=Drosophila guanche TaxID=7266 RepID=A0A3B0JEY9_DROGU|nr:uncharacterized protein LOC117578507 [Drosophila guanche]SPP73860.1 Hypothetical predicted protein [Drosophila guanche]
MIPSTKISSVFEKQLQEIADELRNPFNGQTDVDFKNILDFVSKMWEDDETLKDTCLIKPIVFGCGGHGIRLHNDNKYDVMMEMKFRYYDAITVKKDQDRPGIYHLNFQDLPCNKYMTDKMLSDGSDLKREDVHAWAQAILENAHGSTVRGRREIYLLRYKRRNNSHTIHAVSSTREFYIDFAPAVKLVVDESSAQALPKAWPGPKRSKATTFMLIAADFELSVLNQVGKATKDALLLMQALCIVKNLPKIRNYHHVTLALLLHDWKKIDPQSSLATVFLSLLLNLWDGIRKEDLCYFCDADLSLISNFSKTELAEYATVLKSSMETLTSISLRKKLDEGSCRRFFFK